MPHHDIHDYAKCTPRSADTDVVLQNTRVAQAALLKRCTCAAVVSAAIIMVGWCSFSRATNVAEPTHAYKGRMEEFYLHHREIDNFLSDTKWKCVPGCCEIKNPFGHWGDASLYKETGVRGNCRQKCMKLENCTGYSRNPWKTNPQLHWDCALWFNGACNVNEDNYGTWTKMGTTCQLRSEATVEGQWEPQFAVVDEKKITLKEGRETSAKQTISADEEARISAELPVVAGAEENATKALSHIFSNAWSKGTAEEFSFTMKPQGKNNYLWQWVYQVKNKAKKINVKTKTRECALTPSKSKPPRCLPGTDDPKSGYQKCSEKGAEIKPSD